MEGRERPEKERGQRDTEQEKEQRGTETDREIEPKVLRHALLRVLASIWKRKPKGRQLLSE